MIVHRERWRATKRRVLARGSVLSSFLALLSCASPSDQRIGRVLPELPVVGVVDAGVTTLDASVSPVDASSCTSEPVPGVPQPGLALYILLDRSFAMRSPELKLDKWRPVRDGLVSYVEDAPSELQLGLIYLPSTREICSCNNMPRCNCRDGRPTCVAGTSDPDISIAPLSAGQRNDLTTSLQANEAAANYLGPLAPAVMQSEKYLDGWRASHPDKKVVRVLITASPPNFDGCGGDGSMVDVANLTRDSAVRTYVIAVTNDTRGLDRLAESGGTVKSLFFDYMTTPLDNMVGLMTQIVASEQNCDFLVPGGIDPKTVRPDVALSSSGDAAALPLTLKQVDNRQKCGLAGWYASGNRLSLCDDTCTALHNGQAPLKSSLVTVCTADAPTR